MTGSSPLESMSESSVNRCLTASTSFGLWEARPRDGTLLAVFGSTSQLCIGCLYMQPLSGHLGCQLLPPANLRKSSWWLPEPSPALSALLQLKQSSWNPSYPLFQRVSKLSLLKADEWTHLPPAGDRCQTIFTPCIRHLKKKDWHNTQLLRLNQLHTDGSVRDRIEDSGAGMVVVSQDDLAHEWHAPTGTHTSSFQA